MTEKEQQNAFSADLKKLVNRYGREFDLSYSSVIGCLELEKAILINELINPELYKEE